MARLISCSSCSRVHASDYVCNIKRKRKLESTKDRVDTGIYRSNKWRTIRGQVLEGCFNICLWTFYKENKIVKADCVHHIVELLEDESLAYHEDNLIALSKDKHKLIHSLYKEDKAKIQEELREMKSKWKNEERELRMGIPPL